MRREEDKKTCPLTYNQAEQLLDDVKEIKRALIVSRIVFRVFVSVIVGAAVVIDWFSGHSSFFKDSLRAWLGDG